MGTDQNELEYYKAQHELYEKAVGGDLEAQIQWLTSRRPDRWSRTPSEDTEEHGD